MRRQTSGLEPAGFNFERLPSGAFVSGLAGNCAWLREGELEAFLSGRAGPALAGRLAAAGLLRGRMDLEAVTEALGGRFLSGWAGPAVHIVTLTGRCAMRCVYCSASSNAAGNSGDMSRATARRVLEFIFSSGAPRLVIEFQGGEPMLNFGVLKYFVEQASARAAREGREVHFSLVTSMAVMDEPALRFLTEKRVTICTSLDGPEDLHDANRGAGSHKAVSRWLRRVNELRRSRGGIEAPNAICTVTRASLGRAEEIVDAFVAAGVRRVQLGPLDPLGRASHAWGALGYGAQEFASFYAKALRRAEALTRSSGRAVYEKGALVFFRETRSWSRYRYRNLDLASRLAYNWDGGIYGSDEARMTAGGGDDFFRLGTAGRDTMAGVLSGPLARVLLLSCLPELVQPACARCAFAPYCRVSPAYNYSAQGSFWGDMASSQRCAMFKSVFRLLAAAWADGRRRGVFLKWLEETP